MTRTEALEKMQGYMKTYKGEYNNGMCASKDVFCSVDRFFETCRLVINAINEKDHETIHNVVRIAETAMYAALHSFENEKIDGENADAVEDLLRTLNNMLDTCLREARVLTGKIGTTGKLEYVSVGNSTTDWTVKIKTIRGILFTNYESARMAYSISGTANRQNMTITELKNIAKVVRLINDGWSNLVQRGFSDEVFEGFVEAIQFEKQYGIIRNENEAMIALYGVLNGGAKLVPVVKSVAISYVLKKSDDSAVLVNLYDGEEPKVLRLDVQD